uniref:ermin n=1 Tax=Lonchura striata TaxID=40157 RepID=UPI000B4DE764|nr:ermin [Lonchura striata domestica]
MTEEVPAAATMLACNGSVAPQDGPLQVIGGLEEIAKSVGTVPYTNAEMSPGASPAKENLEENSNSLPEDIPPESFAGEKRCQEKREENAGTPQQGPADIQDTGTNGQRSGEGPGGTAGTGPAGTGTAGIGTAGSGPAGTGTAGTGPAGIGTAGTGPAGTGTAGTGTAGTGTAGIGTAGTGTAGTGTAGTGPAGIGTAGIGPVAAPGREVAETAPGSAEPRGNAAEEAEEEEAEEEEDTEEDEVQVIEIKKENSEASRLQQRDSGKQPSPPGSPGCNSPLQKAGEPPSLGKKNDISRHSYSRYNTISYRRIRKGNTKQRIDEFESMMHL